MNTELGRRILDHITAHRDQFDMGIWGRFDPECGTAAPTSQADEDPCSCPCYRVNDIEDFIRPDGSAVRPGIEGDEAAGLLDLSYEEQYGCRRGRVLALHVTG